MPLLHACFHSLYSTLREAVSSRTANGWTLHASHRRYDPGSDDGSHTGSRVNLICYDSEHDLKIQWKHWDESSTSSRLNALLVLSHDVQCNLEKVIRRKHAASRLILTPLPGVWPGTQSAVDLALASYSLGWNSIEVCRDARLALQRAITLSGRDERLVIFWPAPLEIMGLLPFGSAEREFRPVM